MYKSLAVLLLLGTIAITTAHRNPKYCGAQFSNKLKMVCAFQGESKACLKNIISMEEQLQRKCCDQGCSFDELKTVCCFTQPCLDRCYPGKGYKMGQVY